jgi:hypothetical protein
MGGDLGDLVVGTLCRPLFVSQTGLRVTVGPGVGCFGLPCGDSPKPARDGRGGARAMHRWSAAMWAPPCWPMRFIPTPVGEHLPHHAVYRPHVSPLSAVRFSYKALLRICLVGIPALQCCRTRRNSRRAMNVSHALHVSDLEHREHVRSLFL